MTTKTCRHHWIIETADGPTSWGKCQVCHERKEFKNFVEVTDYKASNVAIFASNGRDNDQEAPLAYAAREL